MQQWSGCLSNDRPIDGGGWGDKRVKVGWKRLHDALAERHIARDDSWSLDSNKIDYEYDQKLDSMISSAFIDAIVSAKK